MLSIPSSYVSSRRFQKEYPMYGLHVLRMVPVLAWTGSVSQLLESLSSPAPVFGMIPICRRTFPTILHIESADANAHRIQGEFGS